MVPLAAVRVWPTLAVPEIVGLPVAALFVAGAVSFSSTVSPVAQPRLFVPVQAIPGSPEANTVLSAMAKLLAVPPVFVAVNVSPKGPL